MSKPLEFRKIKKNVEIKQLIQRMLAIDTKNRIIWKEIFDNNLFKDELPKYLTAESKNYDEYI